MRTSLLLTLLTSGCAFTFDLTGGPRHERLELPGQDLEQRLEPHVKASPRAVAELDAVRARKRVGTIVTWVGIGSLAPCLIASMSSQGDSGLALVAATCGAAVALNLIALFVSPLPGHYGAILRAYNEDFPSTPWSSVRLGVKPVDGPSGTMPETSPVPRE